MSAYPLLKKQQLEKHKIKMARALEGQNRHYKWNTIRCRHWYETAKKCRFDKDELRNIIDEICEPLERRLDWVIGQIPGDFPEDIAENIFAGMRDAKNKLIRSC